MTRVPSPRRRPRRPSCRTILIRRAGALAVVVGLAGVATLGVAGLGAAATRSAAPKPRTVLLIGDSLMAQAAAGIRAALPGTTVVDGSVPGTGLLNGSVDWSTQAAALVAQYHPDVVVASFVGNYDQSLGPLVVDSDAYYAAWATAAQRLTDALRVSVAHVDWVAPAPLRFPNFYGIAASRTGVLLAQYRRLATEPGVGLVTEVSAVAADDGSFASTHAVCGSPVKVRINDGVHFTAAGGDWWGANLGRGIARIEGLEARDACTVMSDLGHAAG